MALVLPRPLSRPHPHLSARRRFPRTSHGDFAFLRGQNAGRVRGDVSHGLSCDPRKTGTAGADRRPGPLPRILVLSEFQAGLIVGTRLRVCLQRTGDHQLPALITRQVDIYGIDNAMIGYPQLLDWLWPMGNSSHKPEIVVSGNEWHGSVAKEGDRLRFVLGEVSPLRSEYLVDAKTGFPYRWVRESSAYHFAEEGWQFSPKRQPNGAILPTFHFQFRYGKAKLIYAQLAIIDEVELMDRVSARDVRAGCRCRNPPARSSRHSQERDAAQQAAPIDDCDRTSRRRGGAGQ